MVSKSIGVVLLYHQQLPLAFRIFQLCRRHQVKFLQHYAELHIPCDFPYHIFTMYYLRERLHMAVIPRFADGHIVISQWLERRVRRNASARVLRIPALNNSGPVQIVPPALAGTSGLALTYIGGGARRDCLPELVTAVSLAHERGVSVRLRCVGLSLECIEVLRQVVTRFELGDRVQLWGYVDNDTLQRVLEETDAFVLLRSCDRSSIACFPTRLPEFLATGRPVILTDVGDVSLYLRDAMNAVLVPPGDVPAVADAIIAMARNPQFRLSIGAEGRRCGAAVFDYNVHGAHLFEFLCAIVSDGRIDVI